MTKRQIIDEIIEINRSAKAEFLAEFEAEELDAYLQHLRAAQTPRELYWKPKQGGPSVQPQPADEEALVSETSLNEPTNPSEPPEGAQEPLLF